jgi:hypothetical protein
MPPKQGDARMTKFAPDEKYKVTPGERAGWYVACGQVFKGKHAYKYACRHARRMQFLAQAPEATEEEKSDG